MIAEVGHFALILALFVAAVQASVPLIGAARGDSAWMNVDRPAAFAQFCLVSLSFGALIWLHVTSDFSVLERGPKQPHRQAADLQNHGRLGQSRRLHDAVGLHPCALRRWRFRCSDATCRPVCAPAPWRCRGMIAFGFHPVHPAHLQPVPAHRSGAAERPRPQSAAAGPRPRVPSAVPLSRLCRLLDGLFLCHRRADRRAASTPPGRAGCAPGRWWRGAR